jgi:sirohydrochlorin cobaltochelatase
MSNSNTAIVLFAHGSRDALWRKPIEHIAHIITQASPETPVACAYLELNAPTLQQACEQLLEQHAQLSNLRVMPLFLGIGKHAREDLPVLMTDLRQRYPKLQIDLLPSVGESLPVLHLIAQQALQSTAA